MVLNDLDKLKGLLKDRDKEVAPAEKKYSTDDLREMAKSFVAAEKVREEIKSPKSDAEYFSLPYYSSSALKLYEKNPSLINYDQKYGNPNYFADIKQTKDMLLGSVIHKAILEPEEWMNNKDMYLAMLSPKDKSIVQKMIEKTLINETTTNILRDVQFSEKTLIFKIKVRDKEVFCKCKIDHFTKQGFLVEVKTMPNLEDMKRKIDDFRYDFQLSFYMEGLKKCGYNPKGVIIIAIEKNDPFESHRYIIDESYLLRGRYGAQQKHWMRGWDEILEERHFNPRKRFEEEFTVLKTDDYKERRDEKTEME